VVFVDRIKVPQLLTVSAIARRISSNTVLTIQKHELSPCPINRSSKILNMGRKRIKLAHPADSEQIRDFIVENAKRSESKALQAFLLKVQTPTRLPFLSRRYDPQEFNLVSHAQIVAAAVHIRGEIAETPCNNCQVGNGAFLDCVPKWV
jgi:uncharacterized protein DUF3716